MNKLNSNFIEVIRTLHNEALRSVRMLFEISDDKRALHIMAKWPDITIALIDYVDGEDKFGQIVQDLSDIILFPVISIAKAYIDITKQGETELDKLLASSEGPIDVKIKIMELIEGLSVIVREKGHDVPSFQI